MKNDFYYRLEAKNGDGIIKWHYAVWRKGQQPTEEENTNGWQTILDCANDEECKVFITFVETYIEVNNIKRSFVEFALMLKRVLSSVKNELIERNLNF